MSPSGTWVVRLTDTPVAVSWRGVVSRRVLRFLFTRSADGHARPDSPPPWFRLHSDPETKMLSLIGQEVNVYQGVHRGEAAGHLLDEMTYALAVDERGGPLFHAAAVAWRGKGVLIPGPSGSGKTTLAAWLAWHGYDLLSDELVHVDPATEQLRAFARPLHLRESSVAVLEQATGVSLANGDNTGREGWRSTRGWLVPPRTLNPRNTWLTPPLRLLLFPHYVPGQPDTACQLVRLSPAQAGLRLMECLINARNLDGHGFAEVVGLARRVPAYGLAYGALDQVCEQVAALLAGR